jgi:hypothetical protein
LEIERICVSAENNANLAVVVVENISKTPQSVTWKDHPRYVTSTLHSPYMGDGKERGRKIHPQKARLSVYESPPEQ